MFLLTTTASLLWMCLLALLAGLTVPAEPGHGDTVLSVSLQYKFLSLLQPLQFYVAVQGSCLSLPILKSQLSTPYQQTLLGHQLVFHCYEASNKHRHFRSYNSSKLAHLQSIQIGIQCYYLPGLPLLYIEIQGRSPSQPLSSV